MKSDVVVIFNFILSQWSFTPGAFKEAIVNAAFAKFVLSAIWWLTRFMVGRFPGNQAFSVLNALLNTRPAKLTVIVLDVTLIDVFLFFAAVSLLDLRLQFSFFSLWSAALFSFLLVYMFIVTHADIKRY